MLSVSSGYSADYLTGAVGVGRENYYTGAVAAGEPPGRWYGAGAKMLGLHGQVETNDMTALYEHFIDPRDPAFRDPSQWVNADVSRLGHAGRRYQSAEEIFAGLVELEPDASAERRDELWQEASSKSRKNVAFFDATFSVQKSVTVLHTAFEAQEVAARAGGDDQVAEAWAAHREAVEAAIWAGNRAALDYLAERAGYSRVGHHGGAAGRFVDAHDFVVASFFQHDSRNHDPQLHVHNAILNRVQGPDGEWRTLDGRGIYLNRAAAAAVGERVMEEHLARSLGVSFATRPDGKAREIVGIPEHVMGLFSSRRRAITAKTQQLVAEFRMEFGHDPNGLQLDRLQRQATLATRRAKSHDGETSEQRLARWDRELRAEVAGGLAEVAKDVLALAAQPPQVDEWSPAEVLDTALADVQSRKAAWTRADLARAISDTLPAYLGGLNADQVTALIDGLADEGTSRLAVCLTPDGPAAESLPAGLRLADGTSAYDRPGAATYATGDHLTSEQALRRAAIEGGAPALRPEAARRVVDELAEAGVELGADQAAAVLGILTSGARIESLVGPAGTGKSYVVGALAKAWQDPAKWNGQQRRVIGLATSQIATDVLAGEGLGARNITQWLATQGRLEDGRAGRDDYAWRLGSGDLVVVDESAMTNTADLIAIRERVDAAGAKLLLTGDHRQLAAVGAGGGMALVAGAGNSYELTEARRFQQPWEAAASLRLREGDPSVLSEYRKHGRIIDGGPIEQAEAAAVRGYLADTLAGRRSLLISASNDQAERVAAHVRAELVKLGKVAETGVLLARQGTTAGVGDLVQARRNAWHLAGSYGNRGCPINRETYRVVATHADGSIDVTPITETGPDGQHVDEPMRLPADYVAEHLALGYASTAHAAQGLTVDTSHTLAGPGASARGLYVGMSRGRHHNTVYVTTQAVPDDAPTGQTNHTVRRDAQAVLTELFAEPAANAASTDENDAAVIASETAHATAEAIFTPGERFADVAQLATAGRTSSMLDKLVADGHITDEQRRDFAGDTNIDALSRVLRQAEIAGHDPYTVLTEAVSSRSLVGARNPASVLHHRIAATVDLEPAGDSYGDWIPAVDDPAYAHHLAELAAVADTRRDQLGAQTAEEMPAWAVEALGTPPDEQADPDWRADWERRAGTVAAHRELTGHDDETSALPSPPKPGQVEARASWRAAWRALGRPEASRDELEMSDGQLRMRVRAYEREKTWAPPYVAHELSGTNQAEQRHRQTAQLRQVAAETATGPDERTRLEAEAREATELAELLAARRADLEKADHVRARWYAHTAETRAAALRAQAELANRGVDLSPDDRTTAEDWLTAHTEVARSEDEHRPITSEDDLVDERIARDQAVAVLDDIRSDQAHVLEQDIRTETASEPTVDAAHVPDWSSVPTGAEVNDAVVRAQRALAELEARQATDAQRAAEESRSADISLRQRTNPPPVTAIVPTHH